MMQRPKLQSKIIHLIAGILFLILAVITIREFLFGGSLLIYRDIAEFDPKLYLYEALNVFDLEDTRRILYLGPFLSMTTTVGLSSLIAEKLSFLVGQFMIGFLGYIACYKFLLSRVTDDKRKKFIFIAALIFGFFYLYNPFMAQGVGMLVWGYAFSYSLIPLIFYYYDKSLRETRFSNILITSVLISLALAGTAQFLVGLPFFILLPWLLFVCIRKLKFRQPVFPAIRTSLLIFSLWFAISFYWIYMSMQITTASGNTPSPDYILTNQMLDIFSSTASLTNVLRLMPFWWPYIDLQAYSFGFVSTVLSFVIPIAVVLSILFLRYDKLKFELITFALIALFIIFLAKGSQQPLPELYPSLYDIPVVGWMFRNPTLSNAIYLPFCFGMIITFGIYSLLRLKFKNRIENCIKKFACPAILVVSISLVGWPLFTGDFGGIYQDNNKFVGDTVIEESYRINASSESIMVFGDLNKLKTAKSLFPTNHTSLIMTGHDLDVLQRNKISPDKVILDRKEDLPFYFLDDDSVLVKPFTSTRNGAPDEVWSAAGTNDPLHGGFHVYLESFGVNNTDMDYNKGLVFTWNRDKLNIPLEVKGTTDYHLFARYLENEAGGEMKVSLNGRSVNIFSKGSENKFVWKDIGTFDLPSGKHTLMLENHNGLNAVNIFVLIPSSELTELNDKVQGFLNRNELVYILDSDDLFIQGSGRTTFDEQSNQTFLRIDPQSSAYRDIDVAKTSNYIIAINATTCKECQTVNLSIGSVSKQFSLQSNTEGFRLIYFPVTLEAGKTKLRIYSEEGASISRVLLQSDNEEERPDLFAVKETPVSISNINRASPTRYEISVSAERPFMITLDRPYDNLWSAFVNGREYSSLMIYPSINGFYIDDSGFLDITIEYKPQKWFIQGAVITVITIIGSVGYLLWQKHKRIKDYLESFRSKILGHREARQSLQ
jgi:hypothetical protein